ncbi:serine hydrolase domain-containing protein [Thalassospira mesophila]|uniref:Beta-lactamase n=1 Tax=Thalassospira mesophila TaxID=1293891 RepID=A0A1Y2L325_9PROT|nr:serine hydrolase [Thalassospira mesophila]OSQ39577.1 beta-lactamase [Thalassospira mesophila]
MTWLKAIFIGLLLLVIVAISGFFIWLAPVGAGYTAKVLCSRIFVSGLSSERALREDVLSDNNSLLSLITANIDLRHQTVSAHAFGFRTRVAVYRPNLGCTLTDPDHVASLQNTAPVLRPIPPQPLMTAPLPPGTDRRKFNNILADAMDEPTIEPSRRTRAIVVMYKGRVIAERYGEGITVNTPLTGWSMSKSAFSAILGRMRLNGMLPPLNYPVSINEWDTRPNDPRVKITYDELLQMSSGLEFDESYWNPVSDVVQMLFVAPSAAGLAVSKPLAQTPGTVWAYNSGTTNVLSAAMRNLSMSMQQYQALPTELLFRPLGMRHAVIETDSDGYLVGSSFMHATGREWAKLGQLYLQDGVWNGTRLLPKGWVAHATSPAPNAPDGAYGAHWWLKLPDYGNKLSQKGSTLPEIVPADAFFALGHDGQSLSIIPSKDLVIVRLGLTRSHNAFNPRQFVGGIASLFPTHQDDPARDNTTDDTDTPSR